MAVREVKRDGHIGVKPLEFAGKAADTVAWQLANKDFPEGTLYKELDTKDQYQLHDGAWYKLP